MLDRRNFLRGLIAAPAVVRIASLMPIRGIIMDSGIIPAPNDFVYLGSLMPQWNALFLASGGAINYYGGDVTITANYR